MKKPAKTPRPKGPARSAAKPKARPQPRSGPGRETLGAGRHPNDPALATLLARLEQLYEFTEGAVQNHRSVHPTDPALSTLLARLATVEERLDQVLAHLDRGPRPGAKPLAPAPAALGGFNATSDPDTAQFLARTPLFAKLSAAECSLLAQHLEAKTLAAGADLFNQNDFGDAMYVVKTGALEILKNDRLGPLRVAEVRPGSLVGEMALVEDKPRSAHVRAIEDSRLLLLSRGAYTQLKKNHPQVATKFQDELLQLLSARLRQTTEKLVGKP